MHPLLSTILPPFSYEKVNKLDQRQENDQSDESKGKRGKLGFLFVLKKCVSFRSLMTTESTLSSRSLPVETVVPNQVAVRGEAPSSLRKIPSSPKLLLPPNGATIKRPGLPYRSSSVKSLPVQSLDSPRAVRRKGKRMNECRSRSARSFSSNIEKVQTRSPDKALNKCMSLRSFLQEYDDIIILDEYAELSPARLQKLKEERSIDGWLDKYSQIVDEETD
jgi:hypothetical protein